MMSSLRRCLRLLCLRTGMVTLLICVGILESGGQSYDQYKVLKVTPSERDRAELVRFLDEKVTFWTDPELANSTIDFMAPPWNVGSILTYVQARNIPTQFMFQDVEEAIVSQIRNEVDQPKISPSEALRRRDRQRFPHRRQSVFQGFFSFLFGDQSHDQTSRVPRKIKSEDEAGDPGVNALPVEYPHMNWQRYHRLGTIFQFMQDLARQHPHLVEVLSLGKSFEGRDLLVAKIGKKQNYDKPAIFLEGGIHAREWISPATVTFILRQLVLHYDNNRDIVDFYDVYILPVMNPDGYEYTHTKDRLWRKSRSTEPFGLRSFFHSCVGVDLNRNFAFHWADPSIGHQRGGSSSPCVETYQGQRPFSEPESKAVADFVFSQRHLIVLYMSFHSYGQKIVHPWSYTGEPVFDSRELHELGLEMSRAISDESLGQLNFKVGSSPFIQYKASGGSDDWVKGVAGIKWVFLLELPDTGKYGFLLPAKHIVPTARAGMAALRAAASKISYSLVR